MTETLN